MANIVTCDCKPLARIFSYGDSLPVDGADLRTSIGYQEYYGDQTISDFELPYCKTIGEEAFANSSIENIKIPVCTMIGTKAFSESTLKDGDFSSVIEIKSEAFFNCREMEREYDEIYDFSSLKKIGDRAFKLSGMTGHFPSKVIYMPNIEEIGVEAFTYNSEIKFVDGMNFPKCKIIKERAFGGIQARSTALTTSQIILPAIEEIDDCAFSGLNVQNNVIKFGKNLRKIGSNIFQVIGGTPLEGADIYIEATTPPEAMGVLCSENKWPAHIYVPADSIIAYQDADYWSKYRDYYIGFPPEYVPIS